MTKAKLELAGVVLLYSLSTLLMKLAAGSVFLSLPFFVYFSGGVLLLFVYALLWQEMLKKFPLFTAYSARGLAIFYSLLAGAFFFGEQIGFKAILASGLVMLGIVLVTGDEK